MELIEITHQKGYRFKAYHPRHQRIIDSEEEQVPLEYQVNVPPTPSDILRLSFWV